MNKVLKAGVILTGVCAAVVGLVGCIANNNSNKSNNEVWGTKVEAPTELPIATIKVQDFGVIEVELYPDKAPNTVNNFISLANSGFYNGLTFHRIIKDFMIQGGCPEGNGTGSPGYSIAGEFSKNGYKYNDLNHTAGVISMARSSNPDSAGSQFFIMAEDAPHLDGDYAAFGKVVKGMDIVESINSVSTDRNYKPLSEVVIENITVDTRGIDYKNPETIK